MKKRFLAVLLSLCMAAGVLPVAAFAAEGEPEPAPYQAQEEASSSTPSDSGSQPAAVLSARAGNASIEYSTEYGTFYFNPEEGYIAGFAEKDGVTEVVIPDQINGTKVTGIGASAFSGCSSLTKITIPASVTGMGAGAFWGCTGLTSAGPIGGGYNIEFGWTTEIPDFAFDRCSSLTKITVPASVTKIGRFTFSECTGLTSAGPIGGGYDYEFGWTTEIPKNAFAGSGLTSVAIPDGITSIGYSAFIGCSSLTSVTIPDGVTSIESNAFYGCSGLTSVTVPGSVTSIGRSVFWGCNNLTSAGPIGDGYDYEFGWTTEIPACAFSDCTGLTSAVIPSGITSIGEEAFFGCSLTSVTIPDGVTSIGMNAFSGCSMTDLTIPSSIVDMGRNAFSGCRNLTSLTILGSVIGDGAFENCSALARVTIPGSNTSIGANAFSGCSSLTSAGPIGGGYDYEFGWTTEIPNYAFAGCTGLTRATIPDGITKIGTNVFYGCSGLTHVTIPGSVTSISPFYGCTGLTSAGPIGGGYNYEFGWTTEIPDDAFSNCSALTRVTLPDSVTKIGGNAFRECTSLTSVNIPDGVTEIGELAFYSCTGLTRITLPDGVTKIGRSAFSGCTGLTRIRIPGSVTEIGNSAFCDCSGLTSAGPIGYGYDYEFGWTTEIPDFAFAGCTGLTSVDIPDSVTSIGNYAFYRCSSLTGVATPDDLLEIGSYAFYECSSLAGIIIPEGVRSIEEYTFYGCSSLASVVIPSYVSSIGDYAFDGCSSLADVYYNEGISQWEKISVDRNKNRPLFDATIHYYDRGIFRVIKGTLRESEGCQVKWQCTYLMGDNSQPKEAWIKIYAVAKDDSKEELYVYDENAEVISSYPWEREPYNISKTIVTSLSIRGMENKLLAIPGAAFQGYSNLEKVSMSFVSEILTGTFKGCSALQSVDFSSDTLKTIGDHAFSGCSSLKNFTFPSDTNTLKIIGDHAFSGCSSLKNFTFPFDTLKTIGSSAFKDTDLGTITLDKAVSSIGENAFSGCENIRIRCYRNSLAHQYASENQIPFELIDGFSLGRDNNSYPHSRSTSSGGFFGVRNYTLDDALYNRLTQGESAGSKSEIKKEMQEGWGGSCYGIATTMALVYDNVLQLSDITTTTAASYYDLPLPYKDNKLLNSINYYQLSQNVVSPTVSNQGADSYKSLPALIDLLDRNQIAVLCYGYISGGESHGHAILACEAIQQSNGGYIVKLYDENCSPYRQNFIDMTVSADRTSFEFTDANGKFIDNYTCRYLEVASVSDLYSVKPYTAAYSDASAVTMIFPMDSCFSLESKEKESLTYSVANGFSGTMTIHSIQAISNDENSSWKITVPESDTFTVSDCSSGFEMDICSDEDFLSVAGEGIRSVGLNLGNSIIINDGVDGNYSFIVYTSTNTVVAENETNLISIAGSASSAVTVSYAPEISQVIAKSENAITDVTMHSLIQTDIFELSDQNSDDNTVSVTTDPSKPELKGTVSIVGEARIGQTLTADISKLQFIGAADSALTYEWYRDGELIAGADGKTYVPTADDVGKTLTVVVTSANNTGFVISAATEAVLGKPTVSDELNAVSIGKTANGKVSASPTTAKKGDTVTLTVTPDKGYALDKLTVTDKNGDQVKLTEKNGKYTFTMPDGKVDVKASFLRVGTEPVVSFTDVPADTYYADAVAWAVENGVTSGTSTTIFSPDAPCTRAQAVTFLWRAAGSPVVNYAMNFSDVSADAYYSEAVRWAVSQGITKGTSDTTFSPNMTCTRAQIVTFLWRSEKSPASATANPFADVKADAYYADAVLWAVKENITKGTTSTTFSPNADCTRAQIVTFLWRCMK